MKAIGYVKKGASKPIKKTPAEERTHSGRLLEEKDDKEVNPKAKISKKIPGKK